MYLNFSLYLVPSIVRAISSIIFIIPFTTYYLDPVDFGLFALIVAITLPIGPLSSTGSSIVLGANIFTITPLEQKKLFFNILFIDLFLKLFWVTVYWYFADMILVMLLTDYVQIYDTYYKILLLSIMFGVFWPTVSYLIVLKGKAKLHGFIEIIQWITGVSTTIICLLVMELGVMTLFIVPLITNFVSFIVEVIFIYRNVKFNVDAKWIKEVFKVGIPMMPGTFLDAMTRSLDRIFIQYWSNLSQLGVYSHSHTYATMFKLVSKAYERVVNPKILKIFSEEQSTKEISSLMTKWLGVLTFAGLLIVLFSEKIIDIITHGKFIDAYPLVSVLFMILISFSYGIPYTQYLIQKKKILFLMKSQIIVSLFSIGLLAFFVYYWNITGAVIALVISNLVLQYVRSIYAKSLGCDICLGKNTLFSLLIISTALLVNILFRSDVLYQVILDVVFILMVIIKFELVAMAIDLYLGIKIKAKKQANV